MCIHSPGGQSLGQCGGIVKTCSPRHLHLEIGVVSHAAAHTHPHTHSPPQARHPPSHMQQRCRVELKPFLVKQAPSADCGAVIGFAAVALTPMHPSLPLQVLIRSRLCRDCTFTEQGKGLQRLHMRRRSSTPAARPNTAPPKCAAFSGSTHTHTTIMRSPSTQKLQQYLPNARMAVRIQHTHIHTCARTHAHTTTKS